MEESEKRRERLRAMRMEASQADVANYVETSLPNHLSNPLVESSANMLGQSEPCTAPRFDYYTNPMAAFSSSKKRGNQTVSHDYVPSHLNSSPDAYVPSHLNSSPDVYVPSNFPGMRNPEMSPSAPHQFHQHSPDQRFYARGYSGSGGHGSPAMPRPFPMDQRSPNMWGGPRSPYVNHFPGPPPRGMNSPRGPFVNQFPSQLPRDMISPSFVSGPRGNSYPNQTQDMVNHLSPSPSPGYQGSSSPGGGSHGHRGNMTPSPRFGSGRGFGSHGRRFSSDESSRPEQFYNPSMLEDPWKVLQPGIWRPVAPLRSSANTSESWISKFNTKKARVSDASSGRSSSQPSLAEYLAASFNEAANNTPGE